MHLKRAVFGGDGLGAERPPEPEEVYWESFQVSHADLWASQVKATSILATIALAGTTVIAVANFGMGPVMGSVDDLWVHIGMQALHSIA